MRRLHLAANVKAHVGRSHFHPISLSHCFYLHKLKAFIQNYLNSSYVNFEFGILNSKKVNNLNSETYLVKIQVDGAVSPLQTNQAGQYNSLQLTI